MKAVAVMGLLACVIAGCSALPTAGPTASDIRRQEVRNNQTRFDLVDIDDNVVAALLAEPRGSATPCTRSGSAHFVNRRSGSDSTRQGAQDPAQTAGALGVNF